MSQAQTRTVRKKAGSVSLSAEFFTFALHARLRAQHAHLIAMPHSLSATTERRTRFGHNQEGL